jgi:short repeat uncharacterized protein DUF308
VVASSSFGFFFRFLYLSIPPFYLIANNVYGLVAILFGVVPVIWPGAGILTLLWLIGSYSIIFGILLLLLAFRLRGASDVNRPITNPA